MGYAVPSHVSCRAAHTKVSPTTRVRLGPWVDAVDDPGAGGGVDAVGAGVLREGKGEEDADAKEVG